MQSRIKTKKFVLKNNINQWVLSGIVQFPAGLVSHGVNFINVLCAFFADILAPKNFKAKT
jgi:hypothetical protein